MDKTPTRKSKMIWRRKLGIKDRSKPPLPVGDEIKVNNNYQFPVKESPMVVVCTTSGSSPNSSHDSNTSEKCQGSNSPTCSFDMERSPGITGDFFNNANSSPTVAWDFIRPDAPASIKEAAKRLGKELYEHKMKRRKFKHKTDSKPCTPIRKNIKAEISLGHYKKSLDLLKSRLEENPSIASLEKQPAIENSIKIRSRALNKHEEGANSKSEESIFLNKASSEPSFCSDRNGQSSTSSPFKNDEEKNIEGFLRRGSSKRLINFSHYLDDSFDDVFSCPSLNAIAGNCSEGNLHNSQSTTNLELDDGNDVFFLTLDSTF